MPTSTQYEVVKQQVKSFESLGFNASLQVQSMEKGGAPKVTLNQTNWMQYNIPGAVKTNGSQKVYKFCDENWEIVSKQLYTLYMNLRK